MKILKTDEEIRDSVKRISRDINEDFKGCFLNIIQLNSAPALFTDLLLTHLKLTTKLHNLNFKDNDNIFFEDSLTKEFNGANVMLTDGIIISGKTHHLICSILNKFQPKSLSIASMGKKPKLITYNLPKCYSLFDFEDEWVTGYGIGPDEHRTKKFLFDSKNL